MRRILIKLLVIVCLSARTATAQPVGLHSDDNELFGDPQDGTLFPYSVDADFRWPQLRGNPNTTFLSLGRKVIELKTSYLEKVENNNMTGSLPSDQKLGRYFSILATSSPLDEKLIGEAEVAYSTLSLSLAGDERPTMSRFGLKGTWGRTSYGADHRSFASGFVSPNGLKSDHERDETELWGEYNLSSVRIRGAIGQLSEKDSANHSSPTKTARVSLSFSQPAWALQLSSAYSVMSDGGGSNQTTSAGDNSFTFTYRPITFLSINPNLSFKQEWHESGSRTDTPSAGLTLIGTLLRDLKLSGRMSYAQAVSEDPLRERLVFNTGAGVEWKIGKRFFGEQFLSFQMEYKNQLSRDSGIQSQERLTGMLQLKILGF